MDFGFRGDKSASSTTPVVDSNNPNEPNTVNELQVSNPVEPNPNEPLVSGNPPAEPNSNEPNNDSNLTAGTEIEFDGNTYTVDENGNVVDSEGNIFKESKDVKSWIESLEEVNASEDAFTLKDIQDALDVELLDENNNPIEFEDSKEGIVNYVKQVIESAREENYQTAMDTLFAKYPFLDDILTYYQANGNSLDGFNQVTDRSSIEIDENNEEQQINIIKLAWKEKGVKGDVDGYIAYLKNTGNLFKTAQDELDSLKEVDNANKEALRKQAAEAEEKRNKEIAQYWTSVKSIVDSGKIAGYEIPENMTITRDGKKLAVTRNDFFNYIYRVDKNGNSQYAIDLASESPEKQIHDEILRAYLKYVGGNYSDLVKIAENKNKVEKLRLTAKNNKTNTIRVKAPNKTNNTNSKVDFGIK